VFFYPELLLVERTQCLENLHKLFLLARTFYWFPQGQHFNENNPKAPNVHFTPVFESQEYLGGPLVFALYVGVREFVWVQQFGLPEISYAHLGNRFILSKRKQDVIRLEVPVHHIENMDSVNALEDLAHDLFGLLQVELALVGPEPLDHVEQAIVHLLEHHVLHHLGGAVFRKVGLEHVQQAHTVGGKLEEAEDFHFPGHFTEVLDDSFDSNCFAVFPVSGFVNDTKGSLAYLFVHFIIWGNACCFHYSFFCV